MEIKRRSITLPVEHLLKDYTLAMMSLNDPYTTSHCNEVADLVNKAARTLSLDGKTIEKMTLAGHLHDCGKQAIPKGILSKPSTLTASEFRLVQDHVEIGVNLLNSVGFDPEIVRYVAEHHERIDGSGYPDRLRGADLSLGGQLIGVADVASALTSKRTYRTAITKPELEAFFEQEGPTRYNPDLVGAVLKHID